MAGLEEKLCPVCFQEAMEHGECRNCGYHAEESSAVKDYLAPFTILKEKYLLGKSLGQGGFGITYLAENMQSGLRCCIKEYFPSGLLQGRTPDGALILADEENRPEYEEGKQQFIEEACALQELRENISVVDIRDFFEENGTAYFAMELIEGCNLRVFRKNHNPKQTLKMALQMLFLLGSSLAEVHRFGMIHGDISPENILITQDGEIKLIDFGAARSFRQGSERKENLPEAELRSLRAVYAETVSGTVDGHLRTGRNFLLYRVRAQDAGRTEPCERSLLSPVARAVSRCLPAAVGRD